MLALLRKKIFILCCTLLGAALAGAYAHFIKPTYRAQARMLPPQVSSSSATTLFQTVGGAGEIAGSAVGLKNPSELYIGILRSRSVVRPIIVKFNLVAHYQVEDVDAAEAVFNRNLTTTLGKDGILEIELKDHSAEHSAQFLDSLIVQLYETGKRLASDEKRRRDLFYDPWIEDVRSRLEKSEKALLRAESKTGLSRLKGQEELAGSTLAELQIRISAAESELASMAKYAAPANAEYQRAATQLAMLKGQLNEMKHKGATPLQPAMGDIVSSAEFVSRMRRDVKVHENLLEIVLRIAELSKIDETRDVSLMKVLDHPVAPLKPIAPRKRVNIALGAIVGAMIGLALVLWRHGRRERGEGDSFSVALRQALYSWR